MELRLHGYESHGREMVVVCMSMKVCMATREMKKSGFIWKVNGMMGDGSDEMSGHIRCIER